MERTFSFLDKICLGIDQALRTITNQPQTTGAAYPAENAPHQELSDAQRKHSASLMRINHAGEVCAQALYHGQSLVSKSADVQEKLHHAAIEEGDHLAWCKERLDELGSHPSYLNPLWYAGSFCIGLTAGMIGDEWSLGFLAETERQVIKHLEGHLNRLPEADERSFAILKQMELEEAKHRDDAVALGAKELPRLVKQGMSLTAKLMVKTSYYV